MIEDNRKTNKIKLFIILFDIILIIGLFVSFYFWNKNRNSQQTTTEYKEIVFNNFTFKMPSDIKYDVISNKRFKIETKNYDAFVEIYLDMYDNVHKYTDVFQKELIKNGLKVNDYKELIIDNKKVIVFENTENKSLLCYYMFQSFYGYEIELHNKDNSFNTDYLAYIVNILNSAVIDNSVSYDNFDYDILVDFSKNNTNEKDTK